MNLPNRERRDWTLIIFILPIGIILILIVGQIAIRMVPHWSVDAGMESNLDPNSEYIKPISLLQPLLPQILTPFAWAENYLTPMGDVNFPQFFVIEPSYTPSPTEVEPSETQVLPPTETLVPTATTPPPPTATQPSSTPPVEESETPDPTEEPTEPPALCEDTAATNFGGPLPCTYPPTTCEDPAANNFGGPLPCTYPPTTCEDPAANNFGGPLPCTYPPTTCEDPAATNFGGLLPCTYPPPGVISTVPPGYGEVPVPPETGSIPDSTDPYNGSQVGNIIDGTYVIISLGITVSPVSDGNYDLVFYEFNNSGSVYLDWIIIGISNDSDNSDGIDYYEVFNWGDDDPDENSNVGDVAQAAGTENDNHLIPIAGNAEVPPSEDELYDPDYVPPPTESNGPLPQTGVLIDVDQAPSDPPAGNYAFVIVISPEDDPLDPLASGEPAQLDAIATVEEPIPTP